MTRVAVVLAAGSARRFGSDKLSATFRGEPLIAHAIRAAQAAPVDRVVIVAHPGLQLGTWRPAAPAMQVVRVESSALSQSLHAGVAAAGEAAAGEAALGEIDGLFVFLGDMPLVPHGIAAQLAARIGGAYAAMPRQGGKPGHPVLLSRQALHDIARLEGDSGAGKLLRSRDDVVMVECDDPHIHADVDRPEDLVRMAKLTS